MDSFVCRSATVLILATLSVLPSWAQTAATLEWRRVGNTVVDLSLASPAGGPIDRVWFSSDGLRLFARTPAGKIWQTADFESWQPAPAAEPPPRSNVIAPNPEGNISVAHGTRASRLYAAGNFAYRSDDGGLNWTNLTRNGRESILGGPLTDCSDFTAESR